MSENHSIKATDDEKEELTEMLRSWGVIDDDQVAIPHTASTYQTKNKSNRANVMLKILPEDLA